MQTEILHFVQDDNFCVIIVILRSLGDEESGF
jgi:hypothetical protein